MSKLLYAKQEEEKLTPVVTNGSHPGIICMKMRTPFEVSDEDFRKVRWYSRTGRVER
jgi:hypothetical protein